MKKALFLLFVTAFVCLTNYSFGRDGNISGIIKDANKNSLEAVNVIVLQADTAIFVKAGLTDEKGEYNINLKNGSYVLKITLPGYETYTTEKITVTDNTLKIPVIVLNAKNKELKEVAVTAQKPFIEMKQGKIIVNVENSIVSAGNSVMDVLLRSPGVTIDQNDNISLKGRPGVTIMIDGKIQPLSAGDLANILKSMPSGMVDKIELISNPSAKYDAAGTAGIINIKTKKDNRIGWNGSLSLSYIQGFYSKQTGSLNLNYRDKKINVYVSYNPSYRTGLNWVTFDRHFYTNGVYTNAYLQTNWSQIQYDANIASTGIDYNISSKTTIGASVSGENVYLGVKGHYYAKVLDNADQEESYFVTDNNASGHWNNYGANAHLQHNFDSTGTLIKIDLDYATYSNPNFQDFTTHYFYPDGSIMQPDYLLHADIAGHTQIYSFKADFERPLRNNAHLELGIKSSYVTADNEPKFYDRSNGGNLYDSTKSDHFLYGENINAAYINTTKDWKKWSAQFGLRAEQTITTGDEKVTGQTFDKNYLQVFPSLAIQNHLNAQNELGLTISRRIERPTYDALNPYKFFVDPKTYKAGNPYLQPALSYGADLSYTYKQRFITTFSYSVTNNVITQVLVPSGLGDNVTIQTDKNLATMYYYGISGSYTIPIYKWWTNITNINAYYSKYVADLANTNLNEGKPTFDINTTNKLTFKHDWSAELSFFYQAPQLYGYMNMIANWSLSAGVQKNIWNKKGTIRLNASDIFWAQTPGATINYTDYVETFLAHHDTRQVAISFIYRFGKRTVAPVRRHSGGAEEEKQRAGSAGAS